VNRVRVALQRRSGTFRPPTPQTLPVAVTANVVAEAAVAAGAGGLGTTSGAEASALRAAGWRCRSSPGCNAPAPPTGGGGKVADIEFETDVVVKPASAGSSFGVALARDASRLRDALRWQTSRKAEEITVTEPGAWPVCICRQYAVLLRLQACAC
jgi:hypothetical protein